MTRVLDLGSLQIGDRVQDTLLVASESEVPSSVPSSTSATPVGWASTSSTRPGPPMRQ